MRRGRSRVGAGADDEEDDEQQRLKVEDGSLDDRRVALAFALSWINSAVVSVHTIDRREESWSALNEPTRRRRVSSPSPSRSPDSTWSLMTTARPTFLSQSISHAILYEPFDVLTSVLSSSHARVDPDLDQSDYAGRLLVSVPLVATAQSEPYRVAALCTLLSRGCDPDPNRRGADSVKLAWQLDDVLRRAQRGVLSEWAHSELERARACVEDGIEYTVPPEVTGWIGQELAFLKVARADAIRLQHDERTRQIERLERELQAVEQSMRGTELESPARKRVKLASDDEDKELLGSGAAAPRIPTLPSPREEKAGEPMAVDSDERRRPQAPDRQSGRSASNTSTCAAMGTSNRQPDETEIAVMQDIKHAPAPNRRARHIPLPEHCAPTPLSPHEAPESKVSADRRVKFLTNESILARSTMPAPLPWLSFVDHLPPRKSASALQTPPQLGPPANRKMQFADTFQTLSPVEPALSKPAPGEVGFSLSRLPSKERAPPVLSFSSLSSDVAFGLDTSSRRPLALNPESQVSTSTPKSHSSSSIVLVAPSADETCELAAKLPVPTVHLTKLPPFVTNAVLSYYLSHGPHAFDSVPRSQLSHLDAMIARTPTKLEDKLALKRSVEPCLPAPLQVEVTNPPATNGGGGTAWATYATRGDVNRVYRAFNGRKMFAWFEGGGIGVKKG